GRQVLLKLYTKHFWGQKSVAQKTLRNHFCKDVKNLDMTLEKLVQQGLILRDSASGPVSLNIKARSEIDKLVS
ncbi:MAG: (p)ppGpp synthetase, partial [Castellaniella sp.]